VFKGLKLNAKIENTATWVTRSMIRVLNAKNDRLAEIYRKIVEM